jgi:flagellar basal body rod protein FlgG
MNIGLYQSAASLSALERWQDAVSQNITSGQVTGYRKRTVEFSAQADGEINVPDDTSSDGGMPALFPKASNGISFLGGDTKPTGRDLDIAIQGDGFFQVQTPDGAQVYTRDGEFSVRADRTIVNTAGDELMSDSGQPIVLSANGGKIMVNADGTISQGETPVGRVGVQSFVNMQGLVPVAGGMFMDNGTAGATPVDHPNLLQGYTEASNVTPMREMVDMVVISRAYEANQKIIKTTDEQMQKTLDALG